MSFPAVSIIIPCRNEARFIDRCLESVFSFEPVVGDTEVIVVDGMSNDGTRDILRQWKIRYPSLIVLDNPGQIVPKALNLGITAAKGAYILRLDAHAEYPADYLRLCLETSQRTGAENVGGWVRTLPRNGSRQARLVQALTTHGFGVGNARFRLQPTEGPVDTVPYGCFRREVFEHVGLFDERLVRNQDYEFNTRLRRSGGRIWLNPGIQARYYNQGSLRTLLAQAFGTGKWNAWTWRVAPYSFAARHAAPAIFATTLIGLTLAACFSSVGRYALALVLLLHALLGSVASTQQARLYGRWMVPLLPPLFFLYHVTYGMGTLWGLVVLATRKAPLSGKGEPSRWQEAA